MTVKKMAGMKQRTVLQMMMMMMKMLIKNSLVGVLQLFNHKVEVVPAHKNIVSESSSGLSL